MSKICGYFYTKKTSTPSFESRIYDLLCGYHYCRHHNLELKLIGNPKETHPWHKYFSSLDKITQSQIDVEWPIVEKYPDNITNYAESIRSLYQLNPQIQSSIQDLLVKSDFQETDIVIHLSGSIEPSKDCGPIDISWFTETAKEYVQDSGSSRIYVLPENAKLINQIRQHLQGYKVIWDPHLHKSNSKDPELMDLVWIHIMEKANVLIGSRASYLFRLGELRRYPRLSQNVKDSEILGAPEYAFEEPLIHLRPLNQKYYRIFINNYYKNPNNIISLRETFDKKGYVQIRNFIDENRFAEIIQSIGKLPSNWWSNMLGWENERKTFYPWEDIRSSSFIAREKANQKLFAYKYIKSRKDHHLSCNCVICRIHATLYTYIFLEFVSSIVGTPILKTENISITKYEHNDFKTISKESNGSYYFCLSLTNDWYPTYGGLLCLVEHGEIRHTIMLIPNTLTIIKAPMEFFITPVTGPYSLVFVDGWIS